MSQQFEDIFATLHKTAIKECTCGNRNFVASLFHSDACPYKSIADRMLTYHEGEEDHASDYAIKDSDNPKEREVKKDIWQLGLYDTRN